MSLLSDMSDLSYYERCLAELSSDSWTSRTNPYPTRHVRSYTSCPDLAQFRQKSHDMRCSFMLCAAMTPFSTLSAAISYFVRFVMTSPDLSDLSYMSYISDMSDKSDIGYLSGLSAFELTSYDLRGFLRFIG